MKRDIDFGSVKMLCGSFMLLMWLVPSTSLLFADSKQPAAKIGFKTPEEAVAAISEAAATYDVEKIKQIFGPESDDLVQSGDPVQDRNKAAEFAKRAKEKTEVQLAADKKHATFTAGNLNWPFPVPLVKKSGKWYFDAEKGREEILRRRIGQNELDAITICRGFVEAQKQYASEPRDGSVTHEYAQRIISTPGKRDGLYWKDEKGNDAGPISEPIAKAIQEGYSTTGDKPSPYHGYYFKILKGRGPNAPGGAVDFVVNGLMIGGFAMVATPVEYGVSGFKTFVVSHEGIVYQKDMGPESLRWFNEMETYNPDRTWARTDDGWPEEDATMHPQQPPSKE